MSLLSNYQESQAVSDAVAQLIRKQQRAEKVLRHAHKVLGELDAGRGATLTDLWDAIDVFLQGHLVSVID